MQTRPQVSKKPYLERKIVGGAIRKKLVSDTGIHEVESDFRLSLMVKAGNFVPSPSKKNFLWIKLKPSLVSAGIVNVFLLWDGWINGCTLLICWCQHHNICNLTKYQLEVINFSWANASPFHQTTTRAPKIPISPWTEVYSYYIVLNKSDFQSRKGEHHYFLSYSIKSTFSHSGEVIQLLLNGLGSTSFLCNLISDNIIAHSSLSMNCLARIGTGF